MLGTMIALLMVFLLLLVFYLRIRRFPIPEPALPTFSVPSRRSLFHFVFPLQHDTACTTLKHGLDPALIHQLLPATVFRVNDFNGGIHCAVCLTEVSEGEEVRLLPQCGHGFHSDCIDMWLHSNNSCPLCRAPVCEDLSPHSIGIPEEERAAANVLFWGSMDTINTRVIMSEPERMLVIDVPNRVSTSGDGLH